MRDMMEMYNAFLADAELSEHISAIRFFDYPNANEIVEPIIVIDDLMTSLPSNFADNDYLSFINLYQIDVFVKQSDNENGRLLINKLMIRIQRIMWDEFGFHVSMSGKPDYIKDFNLFRQTVTFKGSSYIE